MRMYERDHGWVRVGEWEDRKVKSGGESSEDRMVKRGKEGRGGKGVREKGGRTIMITDIARTALHHKISHPHTGKCITLRDSLVPRAILLHVQNL